MAVSPFLAFGSYAAIRLVSHTAALAVGAAVMLAMALSAGGRKPSPA